MKNCINCGKEFEFNDGRVKKCNACRNESSCHMPSNEEIGKLIEESSQRVAKHLKKMKRISFIKSFIDYAFKLVVLGLLIVLLVK